MFASGLTAGENQDVLARKSSRWWTWLLPLFSIAFFIFFIGPPLLGRPFGPYPLMKVADVLDLFTPLVLIPLYWLLFRLPVNRAPGLKASLVFMVLAAFWVLGQGMHLAANSIGHLLESQAGTPVYNLTNFYDEVLSHYLWHFGVIGLSATIIFSRWREPSARGKAATGAVIAAGIIYGFTYFLIIIEGATTPMGITFAVLFVLFILIWGRKDLKQQPVLFFFLVAYLLAILFFAGWGIYWKGLPEFSKVGLI
jgi:hypothetical protein